MIINFGIHLDGLSPQPPRTALGVATLGPAGLLGVLETQLGLPAGEANRAQALVSYRACLGDAQHGERFYSRSFEVDPINVTGTLLDWRETWYEHGWEGGFSEDAPSRLRDMAAVETSAKDEVPLCRAQRLQRVLSALKERRTQIEKLILQDDPNELALSWRRLLERFPVEVHSGISPTAAAPPGTDLHTLQTTLLGFTQGDASQAREPIALAGDASFIVVRGVSRDISAQAIAEHVMNRDDSTKTLLIAECDGIILDNALERVGSPRCGFQHYSRFRAVTQVLKLSLALLWQPINPHVLLQFLLHPAAPLKRSVRARLAEAVAAEPGVGGTAWKEALHWIEAREHDRGNEDIAKLTDDIRFWLQQARFPTDSGASIEALVQRTQACANWLARCLNSVKAAGERAAYASAYRQAKDLIEALGGLARRGRTRIPKVELDRLLDQVTTPLADPHVFAEAGHVRAATQPAMVIDRWDQVLWWDLAPNTSSLDYPWSNSELAALRAHGVDLPSVDERLRRRSRDWLRPIVNARQQLVLVVHECETGDHPLWNQIQSVFQGWNEVRLDDALLGGRADPTIPALELPTRGLEIQALPRKRRWWRLEPDAPLSPRPTESYSSLEKLFDHPHEWVLGYAARLRTGRAEDLTDGVRLYGNLAHRVFERFFTEIPNWQDLPASEVDAWLAALLPELIRTEGAVLLEPGRGVDRERVSAVIERALPNLLKHLRSANIHTVKPEHSAKAPFRDIGLGGAIDLLLTEVTGRDIVVDVKWGGQRYRGELLQANRHLQLATYAYLCRHETASADQHWPYPAFFIVETGNVLAHDRTVFANARTFAPATGEGVAALWHRVERTYEWRWGQLSRGDIEVIVEGTEPDDDSVRPADALTGDSQPDKFDPFTWLTGWEESQ